ncbi:MAG: hypothetical protein KA790_06335 [Ottowia sp.]|mgnify:CR=1 FL=1|nr:hypothetical protein [Ottowia sp.]
MNITKTVLVAAVLSSLTALSFAQTPAAPAAATAPMASASKPADHPTKTGKMTDPAAKPADHPTKTGKMADPAARPANHPTKQPAAAASATK